MSHIPLNPDETIPPHMHGFDPLPKEDAMKLSEAFPAKMAGLGLNAHQTSFYFDATTLTALLQAQRNECTYDGFGILFGLNAKDQIELFIYRVKALMNDCVISNYEVVEQGAYVENPKTGEIELIRYAIVPINANGFAQLYRIDIDSDKYNNSLTKFKGVFKTDNSKRVYKIKAKKLMAQVTNPSLTTLETNFLTVGYFIGWGVIDLIRKELNSKIGIKLFLGFGTSSLNIRSASCIHLIAIAADHPDAKITDYPLPMVWSTQDQTKPEKYILDDSDDALPFSPFETAFTVGTLGSSCTFAIKDEGTN